MWAVHMCPCPSPTAPPGPASHRQLPSLWCSWGRMGPARLVPMAGGQNLDETQAPGTRSRSQPPDPPHSCTPRQCPARPGPELCSKGWLSCPHEGLSRGVAGSLHEAQLAVRAAAWEGPGAPLPGLCGGRPAWAAEQTWKCCVCMHVLIPGTGLHTCLCTYGGRQEAGEGSSPSAFPETHTWCV